MTVASTSGRWRRRTWLGITGAALVGAGFGVHAWWSQARAPAAPLDSALVPGLVVQRWTVVAVHPMHFGAVPVVLATEDGRRDPVDVLARDPAGPDGVATTEALSLFVVDVRATPDSAGNRPTDEEQGLGAMVLAQALRSEAAPTGLLTLAKRREQHPRGAFGVPLA
jgi:hypothetical protein